MASNNNSTPEAAEGGTPNNPSSPKNSGSSVAGSPYIQMGSIEVPKALQDGEKFIKWDEVSLEKRKKSGGQGKRKWSV